MPKVWRLHWEELVSYTATIVADTEEEALRYFETGGEFDEEPDPVWSEMFRDVTIELEREA